MKKARQLIEALEEGHANKITFSLSAGELAPGFIAATDFISGVMGILKITAQVLDAGVRLSFLAYNISKREDVPKDVRNSFLEVHRAWGVVVGEAREKLPGKWDMLEAVAPINKAKP